MNNEEKEKSNKESEKKIKTNTTTLTTTPIRVKRETRKKILSELSKINKKDYGRKITIDDFVALAIGLVDAKHIEALQQRSLTNTDRLELEYRAYVKAQGSITKDDYLGKLMRGELQTLT
jgi:hypothetical protein